MQQRRAGEVAVRRLEVRSRVYELRMGREQRVECLDGARFDSRDGIGEFRVWRELREATLRLGVVFQRRPALEAILAGDDQLGVGELERRVQHCARALMAKARMIRADPRGGRQPLLAVQRLQLLAWSLSWVRLGRSGSVLLGIRAPFV